MTKATSSNIFIHEGSTSIRLDRFLRQKIKLLSQRQVEQLLASGVLVHLDRQEVAISKARRLQKGDQLNPGEAILWRDMPDLRHLPIADSSRSLNIIYEDKDLLVVDKPAGIPTQPLAPWERATLVNFAVAHDSNLRGVGPRPLEAGLLNRLDQQTSGLVLFARNPATFDHLRRQFQQHRVEKEYLALVQGNLPTVKTVTTALEHDPLDSGRMRLASAKVAARRRQFEAVTVVTPLQQFEHYGLVRVLIRTGVTHQIRLHLASIGHPIYGDRLYGAPQAQSSDSSERHFLHAHRLRFLQRNGKELELKCELPTDLLEILQNQQKTA